MKEAIPEKLYFKIGEVAEITKVKPYVLRYWENEFRIINPKKSLSKQRIYTRRDVELILEIKRLLYKEKYTLEGAKKRIKELRAELSKKKQGKQAAFPFKEMGHVKELKEIRKDLDSIRKLLD